VAVLTSERLDALREERLQRLRAHRASGRKVIGWIAGFTPVEVIRAAGAEPVRLLRGGYQAEARGDRYLRSDACPLCLSSMGAFDIDPLYRLVDAVAAVNTCDMLRRLPESIHRHFGLPVYQLYMPRTSEALPHRVAEFRRQLEWFAGELAAFTGNEVGPKTLAGGIREANRVRGALRGLDELCKGDNPVLSGTDILDAVAFATTLDPEHAVSLIGGIHEMASSVEPTPGSRPRLMLGGSEVAEQDRWLVETIETKADIVTDMLDTGTSWYEEDCPEDGEPMDALARFYFARTGMMRRPNDRAYERARGLVKENRVKAVVWKTLLYCDPWNFEAVRLREEVGVPVLHIDGNYSSENREQLRTRVEAFLENL